MDDAAQGGHNEVVQVDIGIAILVGPARRIDRKTR
jgi:hypothetical protein